MTTKKDKEEEKVEGAIEEKEEAEAIPTGDGTHQSHGDYDPA